LTYILGVRIVEHQSEDWVFERHFPSQMDPPVYHFNFLLIFLSIEVGNYNFEFPSQYTLFLPPEARTKRR